MMILYGNIDKTLYLHGPLNFEKMWIKLSCYYYRVCISCVHWIHI